MMELVTPWVTSRPDIRNLVLCNECIGYQTMSLPTPKGRQHEVIYLPENGHTVVLGTAAAVAKQQWQFCGHVTWPN